MLADTMRAVPRCAECGKSLVVTNYKPAMQLAEKNRWEILREEQQISESHSVDTASKLCEQEGVTAMLRLPLDLPLIHSRRGSADDHLGMRTFRLREHAWKTSIAKVRRNRTGECLTWRCAVPCGKDNYQSAEKTFDGRSVDCRLIG